MPATKPVRPAQQPASNSAATDRDASDSTPAPPTFAQNAALMVKLLIGAAVVLGLLWLLGRA